MSRVQVSYAQKAWTNPIEGSILSDSTMLRLADKALDQLYNMRFAEADSTFQLIENRYPSHPVGPFLKSLTLWWKILPTLTVKDTSHDRAFLKEMDEVIKRSKRLRRQDKKSFDADFFETAAHGFRGRLLSDREQWLRAAQDGKSAMDTIFDLEKADPENADLLFGVGVYNYFSVAVPERYPIVSPLMLFFPDGNKEKGLEQLRRAAYDGRFVAAEAAYFLVQIHTSFEPDYGHSMEFISMLRERYPDNALFHIMQGRIHFRWGQWEEAADVFSEVVSRSTERQSGYVPALTSQAHYYLGRRKMQLDEWDEALRHFETVLRLESEYREDSFFRVHAELRSGMINDLQGKRSEALAAYRRILRMDDRSGSRDRARRFIKTPYGQ